MIVLMLSDLPVLVTEPSVGQSATARVGARTLRFVWHLAPPGHAKEPPRLRRLMFFLYSLILSKGEDDIQWLLLTSIKNISRKRSAYSVRLQREWNKLQRSVMDAKQMPRRAFKVHGDLLPSPKA